MYRTILLLKLTEHDLSCLQKQGAGIHGFLSSWTPAFAGVTNVYKFRRMGFSPCGYFGWHALHTAYAKHKQV